MIAFIGFDSAFKQAGLFAHFDGELLRIAGPGDSKDGKTVTLVDFVPGALHHNVLLYELLR